MRLPSGRACSSAGGAGEEGGDDIGGVPVESDSGTVVAHGGAGVGVPRRLLDVAKRDPGIERSGDEGVTQSVRADGLVDCRPPGDAADDAAGCVAVETLAAAA